MPTPLRIDFVSDVVCPWCAIGLKSLEQAIANLAGEVEVDLHFQPFELNPQMPAHGQDTDEHLAGKYGSTPEQLAANRAMLRERGEALGFHFNPRQRIYNTFDAHRLLHWAGEQGADRQRALKHALLVANFTENRDVSAAAVLAEIAGEAGLDPQAAAQVLASDRYARQVRTQQELYRMRGISAVPSVIVEDRHLVQGGQPVEVFEQALRRVAAAKAGGAPV